MKGSLKTNVYLACLHVDNASLRKLSKETLSRIL